MDGKVKTDASEYSPATPTITLYGFSTNTDSRWLNMFTQNQCETSLLMQKTQRPCSSRRCCPGIMNSFPINSVGKFFSLHSSMHSHLSPAAHGLSNPLGGVMNFSSYFFGMTGMFIRSGAVLHIFTSLSGLGILHRRLFASLGIIAGRRVGALIISLARFSLTSEDGDIMNV